MWFVLRRKASSPRVRPARARRVPLTLEPLEERLTPTLSLSLVVPPSSSYGVTNNLVIKYANTGTTPTPAPVLVVTAPNADANLWLPTDPAVGGTSLQLLATNPDGPAGTLAPGASGSLVVDFTATSSTAGNIQFNIGQLTSGQTIDWASLQSSMQPSTISAAAWPAVFANFTANVGSTTDSYQAALDADATYLAQLGQPTNDVGRLVVYEINKAADTFGSAPLGESVDAALPTPGPDLSFARWFQPGVAGRYQMGTLGLGWTNNWAVTAGADSAGNVTINASGSPRYFTLRGDATYLGIWGDNGTLTALPGGGYQLKEPDGSLTTFNPNGTLNYVQDTNGNRITAAYSGGLLVQLTATNGSYLVLSYTNGLLTRVTDSTGRGSTYSYDAAGQHLLSCTTEFGTTNYGYVTGQGAAVQNALASITYADNTHAYFGYDAEGRLIDEHRDNNQQDVTIAYNPAGGLTATDALGRRTTVLTDDNGQVGQTIDPLGNVTRYTHDLSGDLTAVNGPQGSNWSYTYDLSGNCTTATDPLGLTTSFTHDSRGNLTGYTDARGNTTGYAYDGANNLLSITYANGTQEKYSYNPLGEATQFINANGKAVGYQYNAQGLVTREGFADGTSYSYNYDARGNLQSATGSSGTITFLYQDSAHPDLVTEVAYPNGQYLKFSYNAVGQRTRSVDQTGFTVNYQYDTLGRLQALTDGSGNLIVRYTYDSAGNLVQKDNGNGTRTVYTYDADGNVLSITNLARDHATVNSFNQYTYDAVGNVLSDTNQDGRWAYTYDADGQLIHAVFTPNGTNPDGLTAQDIQYAYDAAGNRVSQTVNGVTTTYVANNVNEYTSSTTNGVTTAYQYDNNGNLIRQTTGGSTTTYSYDLLDELTGMNGPGMTASYGYDPLGNRNSQTVNGTATRFLIDPFGLGDVVSAYTGGGSLTAHYTNGFGLTSQVDAAGHAAYYDFNLIGSTVGITGAAGSYVNKYSYLPFGQTTAITARLANPFTFVGRFGVMQDGPGMFNMRAREYSPVAGQFFASDPLELTGGDVNTRRYTGNGPVSAVDPTGTQQWGPKHSLDASLGRYGKDNKPHLTEGGTPYEVTQEGVRVMGRTIRWNDSGTFRAADGSLEKLDLTNIYGPAPAPALNVQGKVSPNGGSVAGYGGYPTTDETLRSSKATGKLLTPVNPPVVKPLLATPEKLKPSDPASGKSTDSSPTLKDLLKMMDELLQQKYGPGASGSTSSRQSSPATPDKVIEGTTRTVFVSAYATDTSSTTATTRWNDGVVTEDTLKPSPYPGMWEWDATRLFPETVNLGYTTTVHDLRTNSDSAGYAGMLPVKEAPIELSPCNISVTAGGTYSGPVATLRDLNPYAQASDYSPTVWSWSWQTPVTDIRVVPDGGGLFTVNATLDFSGIGPGQGRVNVQVSDGEAYASVDVMAIVTSAGAPQYTTSVSATRLTANKWPSDPPLAIIDTTDPTITSTSQVTVSVGPPSDTSTPVPLVTGTTLTHLPGGVTRIEVDGVVSAVQPGAGPVAAAPLNITLGSEPTLTAQVTLDETSDPYIVNPVSAVAVAGQPVRNVQVATLAGPADDSYRATIDWGDGETSPGQLTALGGDLFSVSGSKPHAYAAAGSATVTVTVTGAGTTQSTTSRISLTTPDAGAPTSRVNPLPATTTSATFTVSWSGQDDAAGSGIAFYDIYVSVDGGPFTPLLTGTTQTATTFTGQVGHRYGFYSVATDNLGHRQPTPTAAQAAISLVAPPPLSPPPPSPPPPPPSPPPPLPPSAPVRTPAVSTVGVFDPATATWYLRDRNTSGAPDAGAFRYGAPGWVPVAGDWGGNGTTTVGVVDPVTGTWYLRNRNSAGAPDIAPFRYGAPGWVPVVGDWDGNGTATIGAVDPATMTWYLRNSNGPGAPDIKPFRFGAPGWIPVAGDWTGSGHTGIGVFDPATATFYLRNSASPGAPDLAPFRYGGPGWRPVVGDWAGDGRSTLAVVDPNGTWYIRTHSGPGAPDIRPFAFGAGGWIPLAGDWQPGRALAMRADGEGPGAAALDAVSLQDTVAAALTRLGAAGASPGLIQRLASAQYRVSTLPAGTLGLAYPGQNRVAISADAAGRGWFVDRTPLADEEFAAGVAPATSPAAGREDLLTVVLHEMGHLAGLPDDGGTSAGDDLMGDVLGVGQRRTQALDAVFANPG